MRKLFVLQGVPASGKSSFIREHALQPNTLSYDNMRDMFTINAHDGYGEDVRSIRKSATTSAINAVHEAARYRMSNGDTLFIDNTNTSRNALKPWLGMARTYGYKSFVLSFGRDLDLDEIIHRDYLRDGREYVGEGPIRRMFDQLSKYDPHPEAEHVYEDHWKFVLNEISLDVADLNDKKEVIVVGDVQGCGNALERLIEQCGGMDDKDRHWIFVGDLFDRGPTPEKVLDLMWPPRRNVTVVEGNHERSVRQTLMGARTFGQSLNTTISVIPESKHKSLLKLVSLPEPIFIFNYGSYENVVTHAGINHNIITYIGDRRIVGRNSDYDYYIGGGSRSQTYLNIGTYDDFMSPLHKSNPPTVRQFFGHRNDYGTDVETPNGLFPSLFPLESKVEEGGVLSAVRLSQDGTYSYEYAKED